MHTRTISQPSGMEVRPNSRPERTGPYMTGTVIDSSIGHIQRSRDIGPDTDEESNLQRLINKRAQQLKDDRQSLKDRLQRHVRLRATQHWTPPTHLSHNLFDARLKSFDTWTHKEGVPSPESLAEADFFFRGTYTSLYKTEFFFPTNSFVENIFTRIKHFVITGNLDHTTYFHFDIRLRHWVPGNIAFAEHARWSPFCVYVTFVKRKAFIDESRRMARLNGTGDILTVALNK